MAKPIDNLKSEFSRDYFLRELHHLLRIESIYLQIAIHINF